MKTKSRQATTNPEIEISSGDRINRKLPTKRDRLIKLLKTRSGHDIASLSGKLGWQHHSTRAALSRLGKAGYAIEKLPPGKQGGSRYRLLPGAAH